MSQHSATGLKRYRAKVANYGFRGAHWQQGDVVEVTPEEEKVIPHHFEELGEADDGSQDPELVKELAQQDKLDALKDKRAKATYDQVRPSVPAGGPASAIDKKPKDMQQEAEDRKAEEKENDERHEAEKKSPKPIASRTSSMTAEERESAAESERQAKHKSR